MKSLRNVFVLFFFSLIVPVVVLIGESPLEPQSSEVIALESEVPQSNPVTVTLSSESKTISAGAPLWLLVSFDIAPSWHLYWKNPGDAGRAPSVKWNLPDGFSVGDGQWPTPEKFEVNGSVVYGYASQLNILFPVYTPKNLDPHASFEIQAHVYWVACSTTCVPGDAILSLKFPLAQQESDTSRNVQKLFTTAKEGIPEELKNISSTLQNGRLLIEIPKADIKTNDIKKMYFFPEDGLAFDPHTDIEWKYDTTSKTLIASITTKDNATIDSSKPINGILVVDEETTLGIKRTSWKVSLKPEIKNSPEHISDGDKTALQAKEHIEELEKQVWYKRVVRMFGEFNGSPFIEMLILAFLGGVILNVMPCVLPIVTVKLFHFVKLRELGNKTIALQAFAFVLGIVSSFWLLAFLMYGLQVAGNAVGWGFQLQEPLFVASLLLILFIFSLSLFGVYEFGLAIASKASSIDADVHQKGVKSYRAEYIESYLSGVLATFVASPCTGPLMGSALGFAVTLNLGYSLALFTCLALGMAAPYILVMLFPPLVRLVPRPGRWMVSFKQFMGFFMLGTVLWLVWVLQSEVPNLKMATVFTSLFIISFALWIWGTWGTFDRLYFIRMIAKIFTTLLLILGIWVLLFGTYKAKQTVSGKHQESKALGSWEAFSPERLQELRKKGTPVFVDFTAKWCLTCQAGAVILELPTVQQAFKKHGVVTMIADWTSGDEEITKFLRSLGRNGVPVYALYTQDQNKDPILLSEFLTEDAVLEALEALPVQEDHNEGS